ncbi:MAG: hypothetical protein R3266_00300 [Gemmatimonadota bacterium]|nr:hypothetical protein [Gemmatimonadota bacterium]
MAVVAEADLGRRLLLAGVFVRVASGYVMAWLYAAARFRLRSTPRTAARIGLAVWFLIYVPQGWFLYAFGLLPVVVVGALLAWAFIECLVAGLLAGVVHQRLKPEYARY